MIRITTKVERSNLLPVVAAMVQQNPSISDQKIANRLMANYKDKLVDGKITWFAIRNARKKIAESALRELAEASPEKAIMEIANEEFNRILMKGVDEATGIFKMAKESGDLKVALQGIDQVRKNLVAIKEYAEKNIIKPQQNLTIHEHLHIVNDLQKYQKLLCPQCRTKINQALLLER